MISRRTVLATGVTALVFHLAAGAGAEPKPAVQGSVEVGEGPLAPTAAGPYVYVALPSGSVAVIDVRRGALVASYAVGPRPRAVAVDRGRNRIYVLHYVTRGGTRGAVSILDAATGEVMRTFEVGRSSSGIAFDPINDLAYVLHYRSHSVWILDGATYERVEVIRGWDLYERGHPVDIVVHEGAGTAPAAAYVSTTEGFVYKLRGTEVVGRVRVAPRFDTPSLAIDPGRNRLYVTSDSRSLVREINTRTLERVRTLHLGPLEPEAVAVDSRNGFIGVLGFPIPEDDDGLYYLAILDRATGRELGRVEVGYGALGVAAVDGSWRFYMSDSFGPDRRRRWATACKSHRDPGWFGLGERRADRWEVDR
jgi:DNA-binding beta-propeller fold protein YncE